MQKKFITLAIFIVVFSIICSPVWAIEAIAVPEVDINLKIENLTRGCKLYILIPENLLRYNMEKFISNNKDNPYLVQAEEADELQEFLNKNDYVGYVNYFKEIGFNQKVNNRFELRHYCFAMGQEETEVIGEYEHDGQKYVQISIKLNEENQFKLVMKDYLVNFDPSGIKFMIDEYGSITYIKVKDYSFSQNLEKSNITEANINYSYIDNSEYNSIENATKITYIILYIILLIIILVIIFLIIKKYKAKKQEVEDRKFWKKKLSKEEMKEEKRKLKEQKKEKNKQKN